VKTWTKDGVCWPKDLLSEEEALSHTRILTFGYDANVVNVAGQASLNSLFEHSINLLNDLSRERKQDLVGPMRIPDINVIQIHSAGSAYHLCCTFSRWTDSQRRRPLDLLLLTSLIEYTISVRRLITQIMFEIPNLALATSFRLPEV
jgi:hypothetical protein